MGFFSGVGSLSTLRNGLGPVGVFDAGVAGDFGSVPGGVPGSPAAADGAGAGDLAGDCGTGGTVSSSGYLSRVICEKSTGLGEVAVGGDLTPALPSTTRATSSAAQAVGHLAHRPRGLVRLDVPDHGIEQVQGGRLVPRCTTSRLEIIRSMTIFDAGAGPEGPGRPPRCAALVSVRMSMYLHGPFLRKLTLAPCSDSVFTNLFTARSTSASDASASFTLRCAGKSHGLRRVVPRF